jgi:hypothetical protein
MKELVGNTIKLSPDAVYCGTRFLHRRYRKVLEARKWRLCGGKRF